MNTYPKIVLISAELENESSINNDARTERLRQFLSRSHFSSGNFTGYSKLKLYNNEKFEYVYLVALKDSNYEEELEMLKSNAFHVFGQKGVIFSDANRHTELILKDGSFEVMGKLTGVERTVAENNGRYFQHGENYYILKVTH